MRTFAVLSLLMLTAFAVADPPCRVITNTPHFIHQSSHNITGTSQIIPHSINAATIYADTHLHLVEVPVPSLVFQHIPAYLVQAPAQQVIAPPAAPVGVGTDDQLAALLGLPSPAVNHNAIISQKCGACHANGAAKGGLTLLDSAGQYNPTTSRNNALTKSLIAARARSTGEDAMPPGAHLDPSKRLPDETIRWMEQ